MVSMASNLLVSFHGLIELRRIVALIYEIITRIQCFGVTEQYCILRMSKYNTGQTIPKKKWTKGCITRKKDKSSIEDITQHIWSVSVYNREFLRVNKFFLQCKPTLIVASITKFQIVQQKFILMVVNVCWLRMLRSDTKRMEEREEVSLRERGREWVRVKEKREQQKRKSGNKLKETVTCVFLKLWLKWKLFSFFYSVIH